MANEMGHDDADKILSDAGGELGRIDQ